MQSKWIVNAFTALIWALAAAAAVYWGLRTTAVVGALSFAPDQAVAAVAGDGSDNASRRSRMANLLGASPTVNASPVDRGADFEKRFTLAGVIAGARGEGIALISVDGKTAKAFPVGATVAPGYVLESVSRREARLASERPETLATTLLLPVQQSSAVAATITSTVTPVAVPASPPSEAAVAAPTDPQLQQTGPPIRRGP